MCNGFTNVASADFNFLLSSQPILLLSLSSSPSTLLNTSRGNTCRNEFHACDSKLPQFSPHKLSVFFLVDF